MGFSNNPVLGDFLFSLSSCLECWCLYLLFWFYAFLKSMASVRVAIKLWLDYKVLAAKLVVLSAVILLSTCTIVEQLVQAAVGVFMCYVGTWDPCTQ